MYYIYILYIYTSDALSCFLIKRNRLINHTKTPLNVLRKKEHLQIWWGHIQKQAKIKKKKK